MRMKCALFGAHRAWFCFCGNQYDAGFFSEDPAMSEVLRMTRRMQIAVLTVGVTLVAAAVSFSIHAEDVIEVVVQVSPHTILVGADQSTMVTVHAEIAYSSVDKVDLTLNGVPVVFTKADARGELVAKFLSTQIKNLFGDNIPSTATLTLSGQTLSGISFTGSDEVRVTAWKQR